MQSLNKATQVVQRAVEVQNLELRCTCDSRPHVSYTLSDYFRSANDPTQSDEYDSVELLAYPISEILSSLLCNNIARSRIMELQSQTCMKI